jgi:hypothetical protein
VLCTHINKYKAVSSCRLKPKENNTYLTFRKGTD